MAVVAEEGEGEGEGIALVTLIGGRMVPEWECVRREEEEEEEGRSRPLLPGVGGVRPPLLPSPLPLRECGSGVGVVAGGGVSPCGGGWAVARGEAAAGKEGAERKDEERGGGGEAGEATTEATTVVAVGMAA